MAVQTSPTPRGARGSSRTVQQKARPVPPGLIDQDLRRGLIAQAAYYRAARRGNRRLVRSILVADPDRSGRGAPGGLSAAPFGSIRGLHVAWVMSGPVSYTHLRAHETVLEL